MPSALLTATKPPAICQQPVSTACLDADLYNDTVAKYRMTAADFAAHAAWMGTVNAQLPAGSSFK